MNLARQGIWLRKDAEYRAQMVTTSYLLSAITGETVTAAELMGEDAQDMATAEAQAEREIEQQLAKIRALTEG